MKGRPALIFGLIFAVGLVAGLFAKTVLFSTPFSSDDKGLDEVASREEALNNADVVVDDVELVQGKQGELVWRMLAKSARYSQDNKLVGVDKPQLTAYYGKERREVYVKADNGEVDQANDNVSLTGDVSGRFGDISLKAQQLDYVGAFNRVFLKGGLDIRRPDLRLTARAVELDLVTRRIEAAGGVKAVFVPKDYDQDVFND